MQRLGGEEPAVERPRGTEHHDERALLSLSTPPCPRRDDGTSLNTVLKSFSGRSLRYTQISRHRSAQCGWSRKASTAADASAIAFGPDEHPRSATRRQPGTADLHRSEMASSTRGFTLLCTPL